MMDAETLLDYLLTAENNVAQQARLAKHASSLDDAFFIYLKNQATSWTQKEPAYAHKMVALAFDATQHSTFLQAQAYAWWAQGNVKVQMGDHEGCLAAYTAASAIFAEQGQPDLVAQLQSNSMLPLINTGRYAEAQTLGQCALPVVQSQPTSSQMANLLLNLGICHSHLGEPHAALQEIQDAATIFAHLGNTYQVARCHVTQSVILRTLVHCGLNNSTV
ncbi:MAG: hypothetical protein JXA33_20930 [Anaerolineae bacterium]|nr:hypothetical protein [Anaerolineae bacterium]